RQRRGGVSVFEGAAEPLEPPGLRLEHAFGGVSSCLCEDAAPIGELQDVSLADVTSCDAARRADLCPEDRPDGLALGPVHGAHRTTPPAARDQDVCCSPC